MGQGVGRAPHRSAADPRVAVDPPVPPVRGAAGARVPGSAAGPCPRRRESFVARLWTRLGVRCLAVGMLLLAVPGGAALGVDRQTQAANDLAYQGSVREQDELQQLKTRLAEFNKVNAG